MPKQIATDTNASLSELEWTPGELVAFDNQDSEMSQPLLLTLPTKITPGLQNTGLRLIYWPQNREVEGWTLYSDHRMLILWPPRISGRAETPNARYAPREGFRHGQGYVVDTAIAGKENIVKYLLHAENFYFYGECLRTGRLVTERNGLEKLAQRFGLRFLLKNQLRFK